MKHLKCLLLALVALIVSGSAWADRVDGSVSDRIGGLGGKYYHLYACYSDGTEYPVIMNGSVAKIANTTTADPYPFYLEDYDTTNKLYKFVNISVAALSGCYISYDVSNATFTFVNSGNVGYIQVFDASLQKSGCYCFSVTDGTNSRAFAGKVNTNIGYNTYNDAKYSYNNDYKATNSFTCVYRFVEATILPTNKLYTFKGCNDYYALTTGSTGTGRRITTATSGTTAEKAWYYTSDKKLIGYSNLYGVCNTYGFTNNTSSYQTFEPIPSTPTSGKYNIMVAEYAHNSGEGTFWYNHGTANTNVNRNSVAVGYNTYCAWTVDEVASSEYYTVQFQTSDGRDLPSGYGFTYNSRSFPNQIPFLIATTVTESDLTFSDPTNWAHAVSIDETNRIITVTYTYTVPQYTVTYHYKYNGVEQASESFVVDENSDYPAPTILPDYANCTDLPTGQVTATAEYDVNVEFPNYPFTIASTYADATWYYIHMRDGNYAQYDASNTANKQTPTVSGKACLDENKWAFIGTPFGFKIVNKAAGENKYVYNDGSTQVYNTLSADGTEFVAKYSAKSYNDGSTTDQGDAGTRKIYLKQKGNNNFYVNYNGGFYYWNNANALGEVGSAMAFEAVTAREDLGYVIGVAETQISNQNGNVGKPGYLSSDAVSALQTAIDAAKTVYEDEGSTEAACTEQTIALQTVINNKTTDDNIVRPEPGKLYTIKGLNDYYALSNGTSGSRIPTGTSPTDENSAWYYNSSTNLIGYVNELGTISTHSVASSGQTFETITFEAAVTLGKLYIRSNYNGSQYWYNHGEDNQGVNRTSPPQSYESNCAWTVEELDASKYYKIEFVNEDGDELPTGYGLVYSDRTYTNALPYIVATTVETAELQASIADGYRSSVSIEGRVITVTYESNDVDYTVVVEGVTEGQGGISLTTGGDKANNDKFVFNGLLVEGTNYTVKSVSGYSLTRTWIETIDEDNANLHVLYIPDFTCTENTAIKTIGDELTSADDIVANTQWYLVKQSRGTSNNLDETQIYDNNGSVKRAGDNADLQKFDLVSEKTSYLIRFVKSAAYPTTGAYNIQFASGKFFSNYDSAPAQNTVPSTTENNPGSYLLSDATHDSNHSSWTGHIAINLTLTGTTYDKRLDNQGKGSNVVFWNAGTDATQNSIWAVYPVTLDETTLYTLNVEGTEDETAGITLSEALGGAQVHDNGTFRTFTAPQKDTDYTINSIADYEANEPTIDGQTLNITYATTLPEYYFNLKNAWTEANTHTEINNSNIGTDPGCYPGTAVAEFSNAVMTAATLLLDRPIADEATFTAAQQAITNALAACTMILPEEGHFYELVSASNNTGVTGARLYVDGTSCLWDQNHAENSNDAQWMFEVVSANDSTYKLYNVSSRKYVPDQTTSNTAISVADEGYAYTLTSLGSKQFGLLTSNSKGLFTGNYANDGSKTNGHLQAYGTPSQGGQNAWYIKEVTPSPVTITITSATRGTFACEYPLDFTDVEGIKAYVCTGKSEGASAHVVMEPVTTVPACTPLYVAGEKNDYSIPVHIGTEFEEIQGYNYLVAVLPGDDGVTDNLKHIESTEGDNTNFILQKKSSGLKFYKVNSETGNNVGVNRAYLHLPTSSVASSKEFYNLPDLDGEATGIETQGFGISELFEGQVYNLNGQKVVTPVKGNIYIVNGKKVVY